MDGTGMDPGSPRAAAAVEFLQRSGHALGLQLAVGDLQRAGPPWLSRPPASCLHGAGAGHLGHRRDRGVRARSRAAPGGAGLRHGRHGVRAQWPVLRVAGVARGIGAVMGGLAVRRGRPHHAGAATGPCRHVLALVVALAIYAGQPDALVLLALGLTLFVVVVLGLRAPLLGGSGPIVRPAADLVLATVAGPPRCPVDASGPPAHRGGHPNHKERDPGSPPP